ncbi:MAG: AmmeMemoRadiSam system protein B [Bacteroidales bacterium]
MITKTNIRKPSFAGMFYPATGAEIRYFLDEITEEEGGEKSGQASGYFLGGVLPHAGMRFCARQAVPFFDQLSRSGQKPGTVVIAHPNHVGQGPPLSVDGHDKWETPMGQVPVDYEMSEELNIRVAPHVQDQEHSAEVLLPYLQYFLPNNFQIVAVNMLSQTAENAGELANKVYKAAKKLQKKVLFLASSDFSHFLTPEKAALLDDMVVDKIMDKDVTGVSDVIKEYNISVCGYGPVMALMEYSKLCDPNYEVHLLSRGHSGEVMPADKVVSYITFLFKIP